MSNKNCLENIKMILLMNNRFKENYKTKLISQRLKFKISYRRRIIQWE